MVENADSGAAVYRCEHCGLDLTDPKNAGFPYEGDWYCSGHHAQLDTGDRVDASEYNSQLEGYVP